MRPARRPSKCQVPGWTKLPVRPLHNSVAVASVAVAERNRCGRHGPPQRALDWLQHAIAAQRETLRPGDVVITGGVTAAVPVERGDVVEAMLGNSSVTVRLHRLRARSTRLGGALTGRSKSRPPHHSQEEPCAQRGTTCRGLPLRSCIAR